MSLIEQTAKRLEQLRQAGVEIPEDIGGDPVPPSGSGDSRSAGGATPAAAALELAAAVKAVEPRPPASGRTRFERPRGLRESPARIPRAPGRRRIPGHQAPLIANAMGKGAAPVANGNLIMVTSALPERARASPPSIWR